MSLVNMKRTKKDKGVITDSPVSPNEDAYPYGLEVNLEDESLKKLGLSSLPEAGETMTMLAQVKVSRASATDTANGGKRKSLSLQITDMALKAKEKKKDMGKQLYG